MQNKFSDRFIKEILQKYKVIAVIGCSREPGKDAHIVPAYLQKHGYNIVPINPFAKQILGRTAYPTVLNLPKELAEKTEIIEVFRPRQEAEFFVDQAIEFKDKIKENKLKVIWLQEGIFLAEGEYKTEERAERSGLILIQNKCMMREHGRLFHDKSKEEVLNEGIKIAQKSNFSG